MPKEKGKVPHMSHIALLAISKRPQNRQYQVYWNLEKAYSRNSTISGRREAYRVNDVNVL
jgi:hypothetical protein